MFKIQLIRCSKKLCQKNDKKREEILSLNNSLYHLHSENIAATYHYILYHYQKEGRKIWAWLSLRDLSAINDKYR